MKGKISILAIFAIAVMIAPGMAVAQRTWGHQEIVRGYTPDFTLVKNANGGEAEIAQRYDLAGTGATGPNGETLRANDPLDPVNMQWKAYYIGPTNDRVTWMQGNPSQTANKFQIRTFINAKPSVVLRHLNTSRNRNNWPWYLYGGSIDWAGVAGENDFVHDHWVQYFGRVRVTDFQPGLDTLEIRGHTVALKHFEVRDGDSYVYVQSQQGNGGGAHDEDYLGVVVLEDAVIDPDRIVFNAGVTDGVAPHWYYYLSVLHTQQMLNIERAAADGKRKTFPYSN